MLGRVAAVMLAAACAVTGTLALTQPLLMPVGARHTRGGSIGRTRQLMQLPRARCWEALDGREVNVVRAAKLSAKGSSQELEEDVVDADTKSALSWLVPVVIVGAVVATAVETTGVDPLEALRSIDFTKTIEEAADKVEALGPYGYLYFSVIYIGAEVLALPAVPLTASAGYLFGAISGTATVLVSATIAAAISFLIGRFLLRSWVERITADNPKFQAIDKAVGAEGFKIVLLLRLSPLLPFALSNYFYGLTAVGFWPYLAATALGFAPGTFAYVYTGEAAKALTSGEEAAGGLPWYAYVGLAAFLGVISKVITDIASEAVRQVEEEAGR